MKVIIPMAGRGTRLRPHTLNLPKPLMNIAGKSMIEWIVEEIKHSSKSPVDEIHFIIGNFGKEVEEKLIATAANIGCKGYIHYQYEALGTAHALYCAREALTGEVFVVYADTLFKGKIETDPKADGIIWTMRVVNPEKYGVVETDSEDYITNFVEKPKKFVSNNAIVGLYFFKEASHLQFEIDELIKNNARENNEFQLTNCLETLKQKGSKIKCAELVEWLDCGNREELLATNKRMLELTYPTQSNFIAHDAKVSNSTIKSGVSIESGAIIENSILENTIVYSGAVIRNSELSNSILGNFSKVNGLRGKIYLGDYSEYEKI